MEKSLNDGKRLFDTLKRVKKYAMPAEIMKGLRPSELMMLHTIAGFERQKEGRGVSISDLGACLGQTLSATSQTVKSLENKKLVKRRAHPPDRRVTQVILCPRAHEMMRQAENEFSDILDKLTAILGKQDTENLIALLDKLSFALEQIKVTSKKPLPASSGIISAGRRQTSS